MWSAYYASTQFMDEQVGRILDELDNLGLRESTAIVFTSDHGYHLGEHTFWQKSNLHEEVIRVPLMISVPGMKPGRSRSVVELVDLMPTLSEICGFDIPKKIHGKSLVPILKDSSKTVKDGALSFNNNGISYRIPDWSYIKYKDGKEEFYNMIKDPNQFNNLVYLKDPLTMNKLSEIRILFEKRLKKFGLKLRK